MNYFSRKIPKEQKIDICLKNLSVEVDKVYNNPEKDEYIRLHSSTLGKDEFLAFSKALLEGNITLGKYNEAYEKLAAETFQSNFCVTSNSGSSANLLAISSLFQDRRLKQGDKVIVPGLAWSTTVFPLVQYGLVPVYVDMCPNTFNLNVEDVKECLKVHDIKAIMLIHTYGNPANMEFFRNFCENEKLILIEDTCESMGATWEGKSVGSFGDVGTFSSYFSHHICTLEGGLTVCKDKALSDMMKSIRSHGWTRGTDFKLDDKENIDNLDPSFLFINTGYNLRLSDPQASVGCVQLSKLSKYIDHRTKVANYYIKKITDDHILSENILFQTVLDKAKSSWFGFPLIFKRLSSENIKNLREKLVESKVETRPFLSGNFALQPVNKKFKHICLNALPNLNFCHGNSFAIPCHQDISFDDVDKICSIISDYLISIQ